MEELIPLLPPKAAAAVGTGVLALVLVRSVLAGLSTAITKIAPASKAGDKVAKGAEIVNKVLEVFPVQGVQEQRPLIALAKRIRARRQRRRARRRAGK